MSKNQTRKTTEQAKNTSSHALNDDQKPKDKAPEQTVPEQDDKTNKTDKTRPKETDKKTAEKLPESKSHPVDKKSPSFFARFKGIIVWLILFAAIAAAVLFTRKDLDWQVQHINDLQSKVAQLSQENQALESRLETQMKEIELRLQGTITETVNQSVSQKVNERVNQNLALPENQAIVTQADIDKIQQSTQQQLAQLQEKLNTLSGQAVNQVQQALSSASEIIETTEQALPPSEAVEQALAQVEEKLQKQLVDVGNKLTELFDFKSDQQALSVKQEEVKKVEKLSPEQIRQWVTELNTQWLLRGNVEQSRAQLQALQQAILLSPRPSATNLTALIVEDLAYLEVFNAQKQSTLDTVSLKQAIQALSPSNLAKTDHTGQENQQGGGNNLNTSETPETQGSLTFDSAVEQLKQTLSGMVSIKKRDQENEITQVESLILQDVLVQRALLLVDRIDWAIVSQSNVLLEQSVEDLQAYIDLTFKDDSAKFKTLLSPFTAYQFEARQPLAIRDYRVEK